jgi:hypothetical protein
MGSREIVWNHANVRRSLEGLAGIIEKTYDLLHGWKG